MPTLFIFTFALLCLGSVLADLSMIILHNNDMHAKFEETSRNSAQCSARDKKAHHCLGGFARTAHVIRQHRRLAAEGKIPKVLFLNAGDIYTGSAWFSVHKWKICVDFMNALKPDALSLGNHEFDSGVLGLAPYVNGLASPIVVANINTSKTPEIAKIKKSVVLDVDGFRIGVIGYLTKETQQISNPGNVGFIDEIKAIRKESEKLDKGGVKIIIALGHSGFMMDQKIAAEVPLVDIVVGGHTNTFLYNGPPPDIEEPEGAYPTVVTQKSGKKVPVVQAFAYTKYLGRLNVTFDDKGELISFAGQPIFMSREIPQEPDVLNLLDSFRPAVEALDNTVVGKTKVVLDATNNLCRYQECNFGNFIADSYVNYVARWNPTKYWTNTPIGIINGGGIRNTIDATDVGGNVTQGALLAATPFGNRIITCTLYGKDLLKTIEIGARSNGETSKGEFLQFSGLHVVYDMTKPAGQRVVSAKARCAECLVPTYDLIEPNKPYNIVTTSFLLDGGDGHYILKEKHWNKQVQDPSDIDVTIEYFHHYSPIYPEVQERIMFANGTDLLPKQTTKPGNISSSGEDLQLKFVNILLICILFMPCTWYTKWMLL